MTMQTNSLPFQVSGANALNGANTTQRNSSADKLAENSSSGFGAAFSRELAQRQQPQPAAPAPAPAPTQQPKQAQQGSKPAQADKPASREPAHQAAAKPAADSAPKTAKADSKGSTEESGDAAQAAEAAEAATTPVTDMLAFMASLQQPAANAAVATDAAAGGSAVEAQLTALENAMKNLKGNATGADGAAVTTDDSGAGLKLATGVVPAATNAVATQDAVLPQGEQDTAQFGAHLREAQQAVPAAAEETAPPLAQLQAQAAKLAEVQNPAAAAGDRIPARVGTQAWDNQVSQRIVYMIGKESAATLTLNPPDLGPVQVVLNVSNDQATVAFSSQQLEVRQALENAMPRLREMMSESGIALGNATVDAGAANQQGSQNNERRAEGGNGNGGGNGLAGTGQGDVAVNEVAPRATRMVALGDRGMVDLFA